MNRVLGLLLFVLGLQTGVARSLDDFEDGVKTSWTDFVTGAGGGITEGFGLLTMDVPAGLAWRPVFVAASRTDERLVLTPGATVELRVDVASVTGSNAFATLAWAPDSRPLPYFAGYFIARSANEVRVGKTVHKYFWNETPATPIKNDNVTLALTLSTDGSNVTVRAQALDKDAGNAVWFDRTFVDSPAADTLASGTDSPPGPFTGAGQFALLGYAEFQPGDPEMSQVNFDNAEVSTPAPTNLFPVIHDVVPINTASFLSRDTRFRFRATDDEPWDFDLGSGIAAFADGPFGAQAISVVSGTGGKTLLADAVPTFFAPNGDYTARLLAVDSEGGSNGLFLRFDSFCPANPVIEVEDYNFGGGQFIDFPSVVNSYQGQTGVIGVDFQDNRTNSGSSLYRPQDPVGTQRSLDYLRSKYPEAGGAGSGVFDYDVSDIQAGEFLVYTRTFPENDYDVYLREAVLNLDRAEAVLERVIQDPGGGQTVTELGRFVGQESGFEYRNIPLTDTNGAPLKVRLSGRETLRLRQLTSAPDDGGIFQNYLVFASQVDACARIESASDPAGPYAPDPVAALTGRIVTVKPLSQQARYFRVRMETSRDNLRLRNARRVGAGLAFDLEFF